VTLPNVTNTILENGLGLQPPSAIGRHVKLGSSSGGTVNTLYEFATIDQAVATLVDGPLCDAVCYCLGEATQGVAPSPVLAMPCTASTSASVGTVTPTRTSTSTGTVATTGSTPHDSYPVRVVIVAPGTLGTATFKYSLDGGNRYTPAIVMPSGGTYTAVGGIVLVFTAGSGPIYFEAGDLFAFATVEPKCTTTNLRSAWTALLLDSRDWEGAHVVGPAADETDLAARFDEMATDVNTAETGRREVWCMIEGPPSISDATLTSTMVTKANSRMSIADDFEDLIVPSTGNQLKRSQAWGLVARAMGVAPHVDPARVKSGALSSANIRLYRDESVTPGLDTARFSTLRTWLRRTGIFVGNFNMFSAPGSDITTLPFRRVMDIMCNTAYFGLVNQSSENFRVDPVPVTDPVTGLRYNRILEIDALRIEGEVQELLNDALLRPGYVSQVVFALSRTDAILTSKTLHYQVKAVPLGYAKQLIGTSSFFNPARAA
jgi:hypothetical protein